MTLDRFLARKNLRADRFATICMVLGVALGTATVDVVLALDANTRRTEAQSWTTNPELSPDFRKTVSLEPARAADAPASPAVATEDVREETHEDYQVMRSAIRLGSLSAFLVGALIVFFSLAVVIEHRRREVALLRSLGATARQVAAVFVREAALVGIAGAVLGFVASIPLTALAARVGITTTGRSHISSLTFPWAEMLAVSAVGAATALLGVVPPLRRLLRLKVPEALRPRFVADAAGPARRKTSSVTLVVLPLALLIYGLMRPLFRELLPSLLFFVVEAVLVVSALLALLVLVPDVTRVVGGRLARIFLPGPAAARLLSTRRIERQGHELAWSVGGVMLVFALLLSLHISTHALKAEVTQFAEVALYERNFVYTQDQTPVPPEVVARVPAGVTITKYSGRTPWPNPVAAVSRSDLLALARDLRRPDLSAIAEHFDENAVILSSLMARRLGLHVGDRLELGNGTGKQTLRVIAVTDAIGFVPMLDTYRNSKTYAIVEAVNYPRLLPFAQPIGSALVLTESSAVVPGSIDWIQFFRQARTARQVFATPGWLYQTARRRETTRDFLIFDVIILLTSVLAAIGVANQLILAVHTRRQELALLRVLGMTADQIRKMLLLEGGFIGLLGGTLAVVLGIPLGFGSIAALKLVSAFEVRFGLPWFYPPLTVAGAVVIALLAALYPARRAASSRSAEFVHYE